MRKSRVVGFLLCLVLLFGVSSITTTDGIALATETGNTRSQLSLPNQEEPPAQGSLELQSQFPVLRNTSGESFEFKADLKWLGSATRRFELNISAPTGWSARVEREFETVEIPAIELEPNKTFPDVVRIVLEPLSGETPAPGEYTVVFTATSGDLTESIELQAIVTDLFRFAFYTASGLLNTEVTAGRENHLSLVVANTGTTVIDRINLLSDTPTGWTITYSPESLMNLEAGFLQQVDLVIQPPDKTIAGDYSLTLRAIAQDLPARTIDMRVSVLTPTIWGWVAILIILVVIAGLGVIFWRLGRR